MPAYAGNYGGNDACIRAYVVHVHCDHLQPAHVAVTAPIPRPYGPCGCYIVPKCGNEQCVPVGALVSEPKVRPHMQYTMMANDGRTGAHEPVNAHVAGQMLPCTRSDAGHMVPKQCTQMRPTRGRSTGRLCTPLCPASNGMLPVVKVYMRAVCASTRVTRMDCPWP